MIQAIHVMELNKTFKSGRKALDGIRLDIRPGEMVALIGASGSGKSTLLRHIAGLERADAKSGAGKVQVYGHPVQGDGKLAKDVRARRSDIGVVFQQFNLVGRLSVLTNVLCGSLGRAPAWRTLCMQFTQEEKRHAMVALARVGMADYALQRASTLSGGQQQRAAIARTLVQRSKVILADEPVSSLDPASSQQVMDHLQSINKTDGITLLISLHQVEYAHRYCPRTIALRDGRIV